MVKKLTDFKGVDGMVVAAKLMRKIIPIVKNPKTREAKESSMAEMIISAVEQNPEEMIGILAILSETPEEEYQCNAATIMVDAMTLMSDEELMGLFGCQSKTPATSGSASESIEASRT